MSAIKRALISVSDKTGVVDLARNLLRHGVSIVSTGGTARLLREEGVAVVEVSDYTGFPEMMDGRVKTLHPAIHGGLLGRRGCDDAEMAAHNVAPIDLVVVNLYPFVETVSRADCTPAMALENIDIGGPAMLRSAAKNHARVGVVVDAADYAGIIDEMEHNAGALSDATRLRLAWKAYAHTANYDANVSNYLGALTADGEMLDYPLSFSVQFTKIRDLRYGENPHQSAAFYAEPAAPAGTIAAARQRQGKALSYNNVVDCDLALECALAFDTRACVIVKHATPCGVAVAGDLRQAYIKAWETDRTSAFGGVIAFNHALDAETARSIIDRQFVEAIIAPSVTPEALKVLAGKNDLRVLESGDRPAALQRLLMKRVSGGLLLQDHDGGAIKDEAQLKTVTRRAPTARELDDLLFAWKVVKYVRSNAIVYARDHRTLGIGGGQTSRVYSARVAALKAQDEKLELDGAVLASDAFFPFRDGVDTAAAAGVSAIIQPGGSKRDKEVVAAADQAGMAMVFTSMRHFLH